MADELVELREMLTKDDLPETEIAVITTRLLEDPRTLKLSMELEIIQTFTYMAKKQSLNFLWNYVGDFVEKMAPLISRDPDIFVEAVYSVCEWESWNDYDDPSVVLSKDRKEPKETVPIQFRSVFHLLADTLLGESNGLQSREKAKCLLKILSNAIVIYVDGIVVILDFDAQHKLFIGIIDWYLVVKREVGDDEFCVKASKFLSVVSKRSKEGCSRIIHHLLRVVASDNLLLVKKILEEAVNHGSVLSQFLQPLIDIIELVDPDAPELFSHIFWSLLKIVSAMQTENHCNCITDSILYVDGNEDNCFSLRKPLSFEHQHPTATGFSSGFQQPQPSQSCSSDRMVEKKIEAKLNQKDEQRSQTTQQQDENLLFLPLPTQQEKEQLNLIYPLSFHNLKAVLKPLQTCPELELNSLQNLLRTLSLHSGTGAVLVQILLDMIKPTIQTPTDDPLLTRVLDILMSIIKKIPTVWNTFPSSSPKSSGCEDKDNEKVMGGAAHVTDSMDLEIPMLFMKLLNPPKSVERSIAQLGQVMHLLQSVVNCKTSTGAYQAQLSQSDIENLCSLLGREGLTSEIYSVAKDVLKKLGRFHMTYQDYICQQLLLMAGKLSQNVPIASETVNGLLEVLSVVMEEDDIIKKRVNLKLEPFCSTLSECIKNLEWEGDETRWLFPLIKLSFKLYENIQEGHVNERNAFFGFANEHKKILNEMIRKDLSLLKNSFSFSVILNMPWLIDIANKKTYFRKKMMGTQRRDSLGIRVSRENVFRESYEQLHSRSPNELLGGLVVVFVGEQGIDGGGLTREWFQLMSEAIILVKIFTAVDEEVTYQPNPNSNAPLSHYKFIGQVLAKALVDGCLVDFELTPSFYKQILGEKVTIEDIEGMDSELYSMLKWCLANNVEGVGLNFSDGAYGEAYDLKVNGQDIEVTEANKEEFVNLKATYRMTTAIEKQLNAFLDGFYGLVPQELVSIFSHEELKLLLSGMPDIDVEVLKTHARYEGYTQNSPVVQWLWEVLSSFDRKDKARFLGFVTGTPGVPSEGFVNLQIARVGASENLPTSHTCSNTLDIPEYSSKEILKGKLSTAIQFQGYQGFQFR